LVPKIGSPSGLCVSFLCASLFLPLYGAEASGQREVKVGHEEVTLHELLWVLHDQSPFSTLHFSAARVAASQEDFGTPQKKKRSHVVAPHASDAPFAHHASHSAEVATLGCGRTVLRPPCFVQAEAQNEVSSPTTQLPCRHTLAVSVVSPSLQTHSCGLHSIAVVHDVGEAALLAPPSLEVALPFEEPQATSVRRGRRSQGRVRMSARLSNLRTTSREA
jgi:hypothetical protein